MNILTLEEEFSPLGVFGVKKPQDLQKKKDDVWVEDDLKAGSGVVVKTKGRSQMVFLYFETFHEIQICRFCPEIDEIRCWAAWNSH